MYAKIQFPDRITCFFSKRFTFVENNSSGILEYENIDRIESYTFFSYHGVAEQERRVGNDYEVSLRVDYPLERAMESDSLCDTLDYAALYALVAAEMSVPSQLLEHVAGRIWRAISGRFPCVAGGRLRIAKLTPPIPGEIGEAVVTVEW